MDDLLSDSTLTFNETLQMLNIFTVLAIIGGLPLGFLIFTTGRHLFWQNRLVYPLSPVLMNIIRSVSFMVLLVLLLPLTQFSLGNTTGPIAVPVPFSVAAIALYARLVDSALREVDKGTIKAVEVLSVSPARIICAILLPKTDAGLPRGLAITLVNLIGCPAMAGIVGGDGVDGLATHSDYYRYETQVIIVTAVAPITLVQVAQVLGDWLAKRADKRDRH